MYVTVSLKSIAKRKNTISSIRFHLENKPNTVKELIAETVKTCVKNYNNQRQENELLQYLSKDTIEPANYDNALKNRCKNISKKGKAFLMSDVRM